ncbi:MAG TPA: RNA ligase family protein [Terriglobales bacterium]|nr:RNA ligase family protein [Terriglobales bacterium]
MALFQRPDAFDHPDWIFEVKQDGFRGTAYIENEHVRLLSRRGNQYKSFGELSSWIGRHLNVENAVIDGEICCLDTEGRSQFGDLIYRRGDPYFFAFDLLWLNGRDLRDLPLVERKEKLRTIIPTAPSRLLYSDHLDYRGKQLFDFACEHDLEGIVAKWKFGSYLPNSNATTWIKIKNPNYTQAEGRGEQIDKHGKQQNPRTSKIRLLEPELLGVD